MDSIVRLDSFFIVTTHVLWMHVVLLVDRPRLVLGRMNPTTGSFT